MCASNSDSSATEIEWYDAEAILFQKETLAKMDIFKLNSTSLSLKDVKIEYIVAGYLINDIAENDCQSKDIKKAEETHSDLIPGVYEGNKKLLLIF